MIQKSEDGRYYLDEETVIMLANYISKLEDLNANYKLQIANLEEQVKNLKELLQIERKQVEILKEEIAELQKKLEAAQKWRTA
ncbi:MAG: hypothetical protein QXQ53_08765, partial [Candidatus Methanosuratincola sp.]